MKRAAPIVVAFVLLTAACASEPSSADAAAFPSNAPTTTELASGETSEAQDPDETSESGTDTDADTESTTTTTTTTPAETVPPTTAPVIGAPPSLVPDCTTVGRVSIGLQTGTLMSGGNEYTYQWTVPSSYTGEPIPVVLDFHGLGSNGAQQALFSGWSAKAEQEGFLSVQPTGLSLAGQRASWELPQFESPLRDDVAMVIDLLDLVSANVCIDPARIYSTGMSNGGFFTAELVCDLSERIAAAVSVAGVTHDESCAPTRAVPYLAFHGTDDAVVPFAGGESTLGSSDDFTSDFFEQVMPDEFAEFTTTFGCTTSADRAITPEVTLTEWVGCEDEISMGFYTIAGGGHTWPGSELSVLSTSLGVTNTDIDATDLAWEFFSNQSLGAA